MVIRVQSGASMRNRLRAASGGGGGPPPPTFPLDGVTAATFAYGTMRLATAYSGAIARFRATAGPDNTVDVFADSNGRITSSSAVTWVSGGGTPFSGTLGNWITTAAASGGAASGDAFVVRLTDQIGTNHWQQTTATVQPYAVQAGVLCVNAVGSRMAVRNPLVDKARNLVQATNPLFSSGAWTLIGCQSSSELTTSVNQRGFAALSANFVFGLRVNTGSTPGVVRGQSIFNATSGVFDGQYAYTPANVPKVVSWNARTNGTTQVVHENSSTDFSTAAACTVGDWPGNLLSAGGIGGDSELACDTFCMIGWGSQLPLAEAATVRSRLVTEYGAA